MRIMALDHGSVRVGVAFSDELRLIASPFDYLPAEPLQELLQQLGELIKERQVGLVVVGMPRNMDGSHGTAAEKVKRFVQQLETALPIPIRTWDERLTSVQANRMLIEGNVRRANRKQLVDKMAAAILLQSFLDSGAAGNE